MVVASNSGPSRSSALLNGLQRSLGGFTAEVLIAVVVFAAPTIVMGALFSLIAQAAVSSSGGVGRMIAANTLGGALAASVFLYLLLPMAGLKAALGVVAIGYLALAPQPGRRAWIGFVALVAALAVFAPPLRFIDAAPGVECAGSTRPARDGGCREVA